MSEMQSPLSEFAEQVVPTFQTSEHEVHSDVWRNFAEDFGLLDENGQQKVEALKKLQDHGFIFVEQRSWAKKDMPGEVVNHQLILACNLDKFRSTEDYDWRSLRRGLGDIAIAEKHAYRAKTTGWRPRYKTLSQIFIDVFDDVPVVDAQDLGAEKEIQPTSLFIIPENDEWKIDEVRGAQGLIGLWEIPSSRNSLNGVYTREKGWESNLTFESYAAMTSLFHPRYGDAARDADGTVMVTNPDGTRGPLTHHLFVDWNAGGHRGRLANSPGLYLSQVCPQAYGPDGLNREDFRIIQGIGAADVLRIERRRARGRNGTLSLNGGTITLGSEYQGAEVMILEQNKWAAIVRGDEHGKTTVVGVLAIDSVQFRDMGEYKHANISDRTVISPDEFVAKFDNGKAFRTLIEQPEAFAAFSRHLEQVGVSMVNFPLTEQLLLAKVGEKYGDNPQFWDFVKRYGDWDRGIHAFLLMNEQVLRPDVLFRVHEMEGSGYFIENAARLMELSCIIEESDDKGSCRIAQAIRSQTALLLMAAQASEVDRPGVSNTDILGLLWNYRQSVEQVCTESDSRYTGKTTHYEQLLDLVSHTDKDSVREVGLQMLEHVWNGQIKHQLTSSSRSNEHVLEVVRNYYRNFDHLFANASETTGDTAEDLAWYRTFFSTKQNVGDWLDLACGPIDRVTNAKGQMIKAAGGNLRGLDLLPRIVPDPKENVHFAQADLRHLPVMNESQDGVMVDWSPFNDLLLRDQQIEVMGESSRVLRFGGMMITDVPWLEGGEGSWEEAAGQYHLSHPDEPYGMIEEAVDGKMKKFYIYPRNELMSLLMSRGFGEFVVEEYRTRSGKPRLRIQAKKLGERVSSIDISNNVV